jgi:hypothetical protein
VKKLLVLGGLALAGCAKPPAAEVSEAAPAPAAVAPPPATAEGKLDAIRAAIKGGGVAAAGYLGDADAEVRRAAVLAVGPVPDGQAAAVPDDDLFPGLHDADKEVRELTAAALRGRGLTDEQVQLARQLASPDVAERLKLLVDLTDSDGVKDVGPWLERLSRDPEPAVRLGAARLAGECRVVFAAWLDRLADSDPDPLVRQGAAYWRGRVKGGR